MAPEPELVVADDAEQLAAEVARAAAGSARRRPSSADGPRWR